MCEAPESTTVAALLEMDRPRVVAVDDLMAYARESRASWPSTT